MRHDQSKWLVHLAESAGDAVWVGDAASIRAFQVLLLEKSELWFEVKDGMPEPTFYLGPGGIW